MAPTIQNPHTFRNYLIEVTIFVFLGINLASCASLTSGLETPIPPVLTQITLTSNPSPVPLMSETSKSEIPMLTVTPSPTQTPMVSVTITTTPKDTCPSIESEMSDNFLSPGQIVFRDGFGSDAQLYILSNSELSLDPFLHDLVQGYVGDFHVSPDGRWLAFAYESLVVSDGKEYMFIPWNTQNWTVDILGWLDDNQSLFIAPYLDPERLPFVRSDEIIIFNPFANQEQRILPSFTYPEDSLFYGYLWRHVAMDVVYDPTLTRVAYLEYENTMVLWDTQNKKELWRFVDPVMLAASPVWTQDGSALAVIALAEDTNQIPDDKDGFQFLLVNRDGEVNPSQEFPYYLGLLQSISWSPNGKYLVYFWKDPETEVYNLYLLDITSQTVLDYCLTNVTSSVVWSPDSQQFIVQVEDEENISRNLIVNVANGRIVELEDIALRPKAWLINVP